MICPFNPSSMRLFFGMVFWILAATGLTAQVLRFSPSVQTANGRSLPLPWLGGLNNPLASSLDWDGDGLNDLWIFDRNGSLALPLRRGQNGWEYRPQWALSLPNLQRWSLLRDYNRDGLMDLFAYARNENTGQTGIGIWRGSRNAQNEMVFSPFKALLYFEIPGQTGRYNLYVSSIDLPHIGDIDGDGDLDVLTFNSSGGYVEFYRNRSVERGWGLDSMDFVLADNCWGRFYESGISEAVDLSPSVDSCAAYTGWNPLRLAQTSGGFRHAGSTVLALDIEGDGDQDLILGDLSFNNLTLLRNARRDTAFVTQQDTLFPSANPCLIDYFPAPSLADVDGDGKLDLLAASNSETQSANRSFWYYRNAATGLGCDFQLQTQTFLIEDMLDFGSNSAPALVDIDNDGDLDLAVGNSGPYLGNGNYEMGLTWLRNLGDAQNPSFQVDTTLPSFRNLGLRRPVPCFGDLDGDGDMDLLMGLEDGSLVYFERQGPSQFAAPVFAYMGIDVGWNAVPQLVDVDGDGDLDLLIGERNGNTNYYENQGNASSPSFSTQVSNAAFSGVDARPAGSVEGNSAPHLLAWQGQRYFFLGSETGSLRRFEGIEGNEQGSFIERALDAQDSLDQGKQSIFAFGDLNGDGQLEVLAGNARGGLACYTLSADVLNSVKVPQKVETLRIFPNPSRDTWVYSPDWQAGEKVEIWDLQGRLCAQAYPDAQGRLSLSLSAGLYCVRQGNRQALLQCLD